MNKDTPQVHPHVDKAHDKLTRGNKVTRKHYTLTITHQYCIGREGGREGSREGGRQGGRDGKEGGREGEMGRREDKSRLVDQEAGNEIYMCRSNICDNSQK